MFDEVFGDVGGECEGDVFRDVEIVHEGGEEGALVVGGDGVAGAVEGLMVRG